MANYYTQEYWSRSPEERLRAAEYAFETARERLEGSRRRLQHPHVVRVVVDAGTRYVDVWTGRITESEPVSMRLDLSADPDHRRQQYRLDLQHYLQALVEFERLRAQSPRSAAAGWSPANPAGDAKAPDPRRPDTERPWAPRPTERPAEAPDWLELRRKAREQARAALERARKKRVRESLAELSEATAQLQLVGDDDGPEATAAAGLVVEIATELEQKSDDGFRQVPSSARFKDWLNTEAERQLFSAEDPRELLAGAKRQGVPDTYLTQRGDSLSRIAKHFYGAEHYWRAIYFHNTCTNWTNPDQIPVGLTLLLP